MTTTKQLEERAYALQCLREDYSLAKGTKVYTLVRSVAKSGMSRTMSVFVVKDGNILNITYLVANALEWKLTDVDGSRAIRVNGCGMDMGFHLVYQLSASLFHGQERGGYALEQVWL